MRCLLVVAALSALISVGCDGHTSVQGRVVDADGKPIPKAIVTFTQQPDEPERSRTYDTTTDDEGHFGVGIIHAPTNTMPFLLEVRKEGYIPHEERLTGTASYQKEIILQPVKK
jgi:hypothetical protein